MINRFINISYAAEGKIDKLKDMLGSTSGTNASLNSIINEEGKGFLDLVLKAALDFAGILAVIMIMYSSYQYLTAFGEEAKAENGKKTLLWVIIGIGILTLSQVISHLVKTEIRS